MQTVITETTLEPGQEARWDAAFQERLADARNQPGWVALQLLVPLDAPHKRVIVGTWESREAWEAWHRTETFQRTRTRMNEADRSDGQERWFDVAQSAGAAH